MDMPQSKANITVKNYFIGLISHINIKGLHHYHYYKKSFNLLSKQGIKIIYFYKKDSAITIDPSIIKYINDQGVTLQRYSTIKELKKQIQQYTGNIIINTFEEKLISLSNQLKKYLGQPITKDPKIFLNKSLQRIYIGKKYPETIVKHIELSPDLYGSFSIQKSQLDNYPYIVKPAGGIQSSGVYKAYNFTDIVAAVKKNKNVIRELNSRGFKNTSIIIEEFIDGSMYTIDYYVDKDQNIAITKPVKIELGIDYGIDDFCNINRYVSRTVENEVSNELLRDFIYKTVDAGKIKNTFVHHEFKITSKGEYKTIEINGRIGGFRLSLYQLGYNLDLLELPFSLKHINNKIHKNTATFAVYSDKIGICKGYNTELISKIKKLPSLERIAFIRTNINKKIGPTKSGYGSNGSITITNTDTKQFQKDFNFIKKNYFNLIIL